jgi:hypothetical protein
VVQVLADGVFTYIPPTGVTGATDSFDYTARVAGSTIADVRAGRRYTIGVSSTVRHRYTHASVR